MILVWPRNFWNSLSGIGLIVGTLFFAAALTPSLVPRTAFTQGALAGASLAIGYGVGVFWRWLWAYMQLPEPGERLRRVTNRAVALICASVVLVFLWRAAGWQNSVRLAMGMEPVDTAHPLIVCVVAALTFIALFIIGRLFAFLLGRMARWLGRFIPRRVANVLAAVAVLFLFWSVANNVLFRTAITALDSSFREIDALIEPDRPQPQSPLKTGSPASLLAWEELGRRGRQFIDSGPGAADISAFTGQPALEPLRVYVGLGAADTPAERARLGFEELKRIGAFERSVLVVISPTGTGWIDPAAMDSVEYLHHGDIASVALQYSYLSSPLSLIVEPEYGTAAAQALFAEVYRYWTTLPAGRRPHLYLHGVSLGAFNSERSAELFEILADPIQGALWSGPPFASRHWRALTSWRNAGSPAWLPQFRDGSLVRFMNQDGSPVPDGTPWGPMRIVYLQYASDPVTFFDFRDAYRQPAWMSPPRGPDVSPELTWYPVVTMLQLALDLAVATTTPLGYGHVYAPEHYVDAWIAVAGVEGWPEDAIARLKLHLRQAMDKAAAEARGG